MVAKLVTTTKADIVAGLARGLVFEQKSHAGSKERAWVDELIGERKAFGYWAFIDEGYTPRMVRLVRGKGSLSKSQPSRQWLDGHPGNWIWENPSNPSRFLLHLFRYGTHAVYVGFLLRKLAQKHGLYPTPMTPAFLCDLAINVSKRGQQWRYKRKDFQIAVRSSFENVMYRLENPTKEAKRYNHIVDHLLAWHGLAPLPEIQGEDHWSTYLSD